MGKGAEEEFSKTGVPGADKGGPKFLGLGGQASPHRQSNTSG